MLVLVAIALITGIFCVHPPGIAIKIGSQGFPNANQLLTPALLSRFSGKNYQNLNIQVSGSDFTLKLSSLNNFLINTLTAILEASIVYSPEQGFNMKLKDFESQSTFNSVITIKGKPYTGTGQLIFDKSSIDFIALFMQNGPKVDFKIKITNVDKSHIAVIYHDHTLNSTLNQYKDILKEAYSQATREFFYYLVNEINRSTFNNLIYAYSNNCAFNATFTQAPVFDRNNNQAIFFFDGAIMDAHSRQPITKDYPIRFPIDDAFRYRDTSIFIGDKIFEGILGHCKDKEFSAKGRAETIKAILEQIPEILKKYSKDDHFIPELTISNPLHIKIGRTQTAITDSTFLFKLSVMKENHKEDIFLVSVILNFNSRMYFEKKTVSFDMIFPSVKDVKVISSKVDINVAKIRAAFQAIMDSFAKDYNSQRPLTNFHEDGIYKYFSLYFEVKGMANSDEYLSILFE